MTANFWRCAGSARVIGPALFSIVLLVGSVPARSAVTDDHAQALSALADVKAAIAEIIHADSSFSTDKNHYQASAQRAIDAIVGARDAAYRGKPAEGADTIGALGHIDGLLDRKETPAWADALRGADAHLRGAVAKLGEVQHARELMDYEVGVSKALSDLEMARGRGSETGVFGGLEGALATTTLGVPDGASQFDACNAPSPAPAYGMHNGLLAVIAVPASDGVHALENDYGVVDVTVKGGTLLLHTAVAATVAAQCGKQHADATPASAGLEAEAPPAASGPPPALYTVAQAKAGETLFMTHCASCHGAKLQGVAAPAVAGTDFLSTALKNGWTLKIIRYLVFEMMPLNNAGSLTPDEYSKLMAFLLASNCYPAGEKPFPVEDQPDFEHIQLAPLAGTHPDQSPLGVCSLS